MQGLISLALTWWWNPVGHANHNRFSPVPFGAFGIVPIGYAAFALALGITAGVVIRRTLPAMAATLAVFVGVRLAVTLWVRPYFAAPARLVLPISSNQAIGIDSPARGQSITYQPASRYWPFQWAELGLFTALALALAAFSAWWICRRLI